MALSRRRLIFGWGVGGLFVASRGTFDTAGDLAAQTAAPNGPSKEEAGLWFTKRRNWGRWSTNPEAGATNLVTDRKRIDAAGLVKRGRSISLGREFAPEEHKVQQFEGAVVDHYGFDYHGYTVTHFDALTHVWDKNGMWDGRDPKKEIDATGTHWGAVTAFGNGVVTRGVLLDVPRYRKKPFVDVGEPVTGQELEAIAKAQRVDIRPGDALLVYSGREAFVRSNGAYGGARMPGLDLTASAFVRDKDVAVLCWDMMDARPDPYGTPWPVHGVIFAYGVPLIDNSLLEPLANACAEEHRYEFMFVTLPLKIRAGTGCPVNPVAIL